MLREIGRKRALVTTDSASTLIGLDTIVERATRLHRQRPKDKNKLYALHAVLCAAGFNLRWLMRAIARLLAKGLSWASILVALTGVLSPIGATLADLHRKTLPLAAAR